ncbi:TPA: tetratricopeptide repeat protein, partial [Candidatus Bipolaricaulota bacterium]|nr:tetratricopeptide repeat protein [Candidatus Bipolaricaulota bacterium]
EGAALSDLGLIYASVGEHGKALECLEQACRIFEELGERHRLGLALNNLGNLYLRLEEPQKALEYFQQAYRLRKELGDRRRQALDLSGIGMAHLELEGYQEALKSFEQALKIVDELGIECPKIELLSRKGLAHLGLEDRSEALRCSQEAIKLLEEGKVTIEYPEEVYFNHFRILRACGEEHKYPAIALEALKKAHDEVARKADNIKDGVLRKGFLTVKLNQEILREWEQRAG